MDVRERGDKTELIWDIGQITVLGRKNGGSWILIYIAENANIFFDNLQGFKKIRKKIFI